MKKCTQIKNMSSTTNPVSESPKTSELTPAEAFWQTSTPSTPSTPSVRHPTSSTSKGGWNREAWSRKRTPAEIERIEANRERDFADRIMMCMKPECAMYRTFEKCEHNIIRVTSMEPFVFADVKKT
jgi:hypothetical protein